MRSDAPSTTAAFVAAARELGMLLPDGVRIADDPYGAAFAGSKLPRLLARSRVGAPLVQLPGLGTWVSYMQVRTRVFDDVVRAFVARDARAQVVLLGAGYDCRALRLPELAHVPVFEVDHPTTQGHKRTVLAKLGTRSPAHYLTWNFEDRPMAELPDALAAAGLDRTAPVLTIWEGVTTYLTEAAIDASLRAIRAWSPAGEASGARSEPRSGERSGPRSGGRANEQTSPPGSALALTYMTMGRVVPKSLATRVVATFVRSRGEPFRWGSTPEVLAPFLAERGFTVTRDRSFDDVAHELLPPRLAHLVRRGSRFAVAS